MKQIIIVISMLTHFNDDRRPIRFTTSTNVVTAPEGTVEFDGTNTL